MEHSPRWGTTGMDTKWETRTRGNENEGGHTGSGPDQSYPELTGVVSERVLTATLFSAMTEFLCAVWCCVMVGPDQPTLVMQQLINTCSVSHYL